MSQDRVTKPVQSAMNPQHQRSSREKPLPWWTPVDNPETKRHPLFRNVWFAVSVLLVASTCLVVYSAGWELSTQRYLRGFLDAIVPAASAGDKKVEARLHRMNNFPAEPITYLTGGPALIVMVSSTPLTAEPSSTSTTL